MGFVHLHCHTQYSLLDGAIRLNDLIARTKAFGQNAVAITDHGVMYGAVEFHDKAIDAGIKPIIGCEVYVAPTGMEVKEVIHGLPRYYHLILLASTYEGYTNLMRLTSIAHEQGFYHKPRIDRRALQELNAGLIAMSACLQGEIPYWLLRGNEERAIESLDFYRSTFDDRFFLEIQVNGLADQDQVNPLVVDMARRYSLPLVATNDCHYLNATDAKAHEVLLCIQTQNTIQDQDRMTFNTDQLYLKSPQEMETAFAHIPEALEMTEEVAKRCHVEIPKGKYYFPVFPAEKGKSLEELIEEKAWQGLHAIMAEIPGDYQERLKGELSVIESMGFASYFLIVADYINYAKTHGIPVGPGRGSAAGSLVAYALGITDIDPIRWGLLFERFLNPERKNLPDIDVDFCQERRDEVIEYVKNKYGMRFVAQITTFGNMKARAVVRDVGRVLGLSFSEVDAIAKLIPNDLKMTLDRALAEEPRLKERLEHDPQVARLIDIARSLEGLSRHASVHAGGVVISDDQPITDHVPIYVDKKGMPISQYDMIRLERVGLIKFDLLGLKTLTVIHKALEILKSNGIALDLDTTPLNDKPTYKLIGDGDTSSVFQLESAGMRQMLRQLKPEKFEDIIAAVALYRPGPMDLIPSYIERKHSREKIDYLHPILEPILKETYGIIVYQEQVMQIAQLVAGYSLGKADLLRRAMGKKKPEEMAKHREDFIAGAIRKGVPKETASEMFSLMEKFAEYGFNKSHAAAYALVAYQTAYLRCHYFKEFMAANLTLDLNNTDKVVQHIAECRVNNVAILSPDINESNWEFVTTDKGIRFGLGGVKNVGKGAVEIILKGREQGRFADIGDFVHRINLTKVNRRVLESLLKAGAFDSLYKNRRALFEVLDALISDAQKASRAREDAQTTLFNLEGFEDNGRETVIPEIPDWPDKERLKMEKECLGFYISGHPLNGYATLIEKFTTVNTQNLSENSGKAILAGVIQNLDVRRNPRGELWARGMLEDLYGRAPIVFFSKYYGEFQSAIMSEEPVIIKARVEHGEGKNEENIQVDMIAEEVYPIEQAEAVFASRILVRIQESDTPEQIRELKEGITGFKGSCPLGFEITTKNAVINIDAGKSYLVSPSRAFVERVQRILGPSRVEIQ
jgi:DNA polymerase-3 subunit alpha